MELCPVCGAGQYAKSWEKLFHCHKCGHWWSKGEFEMPCKGKKKGKKGGRK